MLRCLLRPVGAAYAAVTRLRGALYASKRLRSEALARPVVSVGNLSLGGAGKTPFAAALARAALQRGLKPAILSRGYRRRSTGTVVVSDGSGPRVGRHEAGDEAWMLAQELPGVRVVVATHRYQAGLVAEQQLGAQLHILDDGYQHLALQRDLNLLLVDATRDPAEERVLPAGRLREPPSAMARADLIVLTRTHLSERVEAVWTWLTSLYPRIPVVCAGQRVTGLRSLDGERQAVDKLQGRSVLALASIGNPEAFVDDLERLGMLVDARCYFRDHHAYTTSDMEQVESVWRRSGAEAIVTTVKDLVRLDGVISASLPVHALEIEALLPEEKDFGSSLEAVLAEAAG